MTPEDLLSQYGKHFEGNMNPHTRNIRTSKESQQKHHCTECRASPKKSCYLKFHLCYCLELVPESNKPGASMVICGERFGLFSPKGCYTHPYCHGGNEVFKNLKLGKALDHVESGPHIHFEAKTEEDEEDRKEGEFDMAKWEQKQREKEEQRILKKKKDGEAMKQNAALLKSHKSHKSRKPQQLAGKCAGFASKRK
ncbi:hypothetical protein BU23DRAFT_639328 [Bimuria novae-zelandiae CBS 107.79]|uniref:Uncharacterized protein n=1 Tax=Bimuria novae-zelandiae CBS 107.79 TaxID=1447943 RepID=A0A6A5V8A8_9PLEO|nr:hypothetical protein BU23DRAFT_639328 [Bimuria novae-zelandiae CBS 107.79]